MSDAKLDYGMATPNDAVGAVRSQAGDGGSPEWASRDARGQVGRGELASPGRTVCAVPFTLKRSSDLWDAGSYTTKRETAHGLLRLELERLVIQWRLAVRTESLERASWTAKDEIGPVRETAVPLADVAGAAVPRSRWGFLKGPRLVVTAADLVAFDEIAGGHGLKLKHPAKLVLRIRRADRLLAEEFAAELVLAVARLPRGGEETGPVAVPASGDAKARLAKAGEEVVSPAPSPAPPRRRIPSTD